MTSVPAEGTRPSDAERDRALAILREGAGTGRLSHDTFVRRMNFVLRAQSRGELADAIRDLPREEPRVTRRLRDFRSRLPRLEVIRSPSPTRPPARADGWPGAGPPAQPSGVVGAWFAFLERLGISPHSCIRYLGTGLPSMS